VSVTATTKIGQGRSAQAFRMGNIVRKLFVGSAVADLVNTFLLGAPCPYRWSEPAIRAAFYRRRVLAALAEYWDCGVRVANATGWGYDEEAGAHYLDAEYIEGKEASLSTPFEGAGNDFHELKWVVLPAFRTKLLEAGFDGTLWQAGEGQPCAYANFKKARDDQGRTIWWCIDAESGVTAIAASDPRSQLRFYLPWMTRHRKPMFDDLSSGRLATYLQKHGAEITAKLGLDTFLLLMQDAEQLTVVQKEWKQQSRLEGSIRNAHCDGKIDVEGQAYYLSHKLRWLPILALIMLDKLIAKVGGGTIWLIEAAAKVSLQIAINHLWQFVTSHSYRIGLGKSFVRSRIIKWKGHLSDDQTATLMAELDDGKVDVCLADLGVCVGLKPLAYAIAAAISILCYHHLLPAIVLLAIPYTSSGLRSAYLFGRIAFSRKLRWRWAAWILGAFSFTPKAGITAIPLLMMISSGDDAISEFIIYESFSAGAEHFPIWGGRGSGVEYFLNRIARWLIRKVNQ